LEDRCTPAAVAWDGGGNDLNWFNRFNWTNDTLPTLSDDVTISGASGTVQISDTFGVGQANTLVCDGNLLVSTGTLQVASDSEINGNFTLGGVVFDGVVTGTGTLTINGDLTWLAGGVMAGTGKTILNGTTTITGSTFGSMRETRTVENAGDATVVAGTSFVFRDNPVFHNLASGTLTFANGSGIGSFFVGTSSKLINDGTTTVSGPSATTIVVAVENSGTIAADGPLTITPGLTNTGTVDAAGTLTVGDVFTAATTTNSGTITAVGALSLPVLTNSGTITAGNTLTANTSTTNSGTITAAGAITTGNLTNTGTVTAQNALSASGTVTNSNTITAAGTLTLGATTNSGLIDANGNASMSSLNNTATGTVDAAGALSPGAVVNAGTILATGAANLSTLNNTGTITAQNALTANSTVTNSGTITAASTLTLGATTNSGLIDANGNASMSGLTNTGTVDVAGASFSVSGSNAASILLGTGTTMNAGGTFTLFSGSTITGGAVAVSTFNQLVPNGTVSVDKVQLTGGSINAPVDSQMTIGTLEQNGTVTGLGTVIVTNRWTFTNGSLTGGGRFVTQGTSTLSGGFFATIGNRIVENAGSALVDANQSFTFTAGANWTNLPGSVFELRNNSTASTFFVNAADKFTNRGTLLKTGSGTGTMSLPVVNEAGGTIQVTGGTLTLPGGATSAGNFDVASGAALRLTGNSTLQAGATSTGAGETQLAAILTVAGSAALSNLKVESGTVTANAPLSVTNLNLNGTLAGTSPVTVSNSLTLPGTGTVNTTLNLTDWNFASGTLTGTGTVNVGGQLNWSGTGTLTGSTALNANGPVNMSGGTMSTTGIATINGPFTWTGGTMSTSGRTVLNGTTTVNGTATASGRQIENAGTATVASGSINFGSAAKWTNLPGGVFEVRSGDVFGASPSGQFINQGTIRKTTSGTANIRVPVTSQAGSTIDVQQGTLQLFGNGNSLAGSSNIVAGSTLGINGTTTLQAGTTNTGTGEFLLGATTLTVAGSAALNNFRVQGGTATVNAPLALGTFTLNGTLNGTGNVTVTGPFNWTGGNMSGTGRTILSGTGLITGNPVTLDGRTVDSTAAVTIGAPPSTASLQFRNAAVWNNLSGAVLELTGTSGISNSGAAASAVVNNSGTIRKSGSAGNVSSIAVPLNNTGRLEITGGDLTTAANSHHSGVADIAATGRWVPNNGVTFLDAGGTTTGAGVVLVQGSANLTAAGAATVARLQQNAGTVTDNAGLTIGDYLFNGGTLTGTGKTTLTGASAFAGTGQKTITAHTMDNAGTVTWSQTGAIQFTNGAVFNNLAGALFDVTNDVAIAPSPFGGAVPAFNNAGTMRKSVGSGPIFPSSGPRTSWNVPLTNTGVIDVRAGNFAVVAPSFGLPAGTPMLTNSGTIQVGTATSSAAAVILPGTTYTLAGGTLTGTGQVGGPTTLTIGPGATLGGTVTVNGSLINRGTVQPSTTSGTLTVTGNYTQVDDATADGRLVIGLRGDSPSGLFGKLRVNGTSNLSGALAVFSDGGFLPDFGDVFEVFRSIGARTGDFTYPAGGYDLDGYRVLDHQYDGTGLRLNLVTEVGALPVIDPIDDVTVNEGQTVSLTATVSGAEPPGPLTFSLADGSSSGATIDPNTGAFEFFAPAGPGEYAFQIQAHDPSAPTDPVDVETFKVTVLNVAPDVSITGGQPNLDEGDEFTASGSFTDPGADTWTATVDYGDETGVQALTLNPNKTFALDHTYLDNGDFTATVRVFDGNDYGTATFVTHVANLVPVLVVAGNQSADEGTEGTFELGSFADFGASDAPWTVTVDWGDESDPTVFETLNQGGIDPATHTFADSGNYTVTVTVTDKDGASTSATFEVAVANLAPVASVSGPDNGVRGQVRTFTLSATDPSSVDQAHGFTFSIDWGDGTTQDATGSSGTTVEHTFTDSGDYTVRVIAIDKDLGASAEATHAIAIVGAEVQGGVLVVGGTTGNDDIQVKKGAGDGSSLEVIVNGVNLGVFGGLTRAVVYGQAGDDTIDATGSTDLALELYGGAGNDHLKGGSKDDVLDGGTGNDELIGGLGRDILVGGSGSDQLNSQSGDDILIGGLFLGEDLTEVRHAALLTVAGEWSSGDSFAARIAALSSYLAPRVTDDGVTDYLTGAAGSDWYFAHTSGTPNAIDALNGANGQDVVTPI
jgi:hypothetical protein